MKRKLLLTIMSISLVATSLVGCSSGKEKKENVTEEVIIEKETQESEEHSGVLDLIDKSDALVESIQEQTQVLEQESVETPTIETKDWSTAYDTFFENYKMSDNLELTGKMEQDGLVMDMLIASANDNTCFSMNVSYLENQPTSFAVYQIDGISYVYYEIATEKGWLYTTETTSSDENSTTTIGGSMTVEDTFNVETFTNVEYVEEINENNVIYDVLSVIDETGEILKVFVNRDTQKIDKMLTNQDGTDVVFYIKEIENIELPAEAANATESTAEEIAGIMLAVIFGSMGDLGDLGVSME